MDRDRENGAIVCRVVWQTLWFESLLLCGHWSLDVGCQCTHNRSICTLLSLDCTEPLEVCRLEPKENQTSRKKSESNAGTQIQNVIYSLFDKFFFLVMTVLTSKIENRKSNHYMKQHKWTANMLNFMSHLRYSEKKSIRRFGVHQMLILYAINQK